MVVFYNRFAACAAQPTTRYRAAVAPAIVAGEAVSPAGGHDFDITPQPSCAYILWLKVTLNLTYGYGPFLGDFYDHVAFCKG
jgi:hypothetical protein